MNSNIERVLDLVDQCLDRFFTLEEAIDWALEQLPIVSREELVLAICDDTKDVYRYAQDWD
jgi:hypothetical protein